MLALEPAWRDFEVTWVTLEAPDVEFLLRESSKVLAHGPTNRSLRALLRNFGLAWRTVGDTRAETILSTGAGLAVPFLIVGRLRGRRCVYVESLTRINSPSMSGWMVYLVADEFFVQWPTAARRRRMRFEGSIL